MWSDNDIDKAFQRLSPPEPEPAPFPLDAWLRLEAQLDEAVIERAVRQRVWQFFAAEVAVVALVALAWLLWPTKTGLVPARMAATATQQAAAERRPTDEPASGRNAPAAAAATASQLPGRAVTAVAPMPAASAPVTVRSQAGTRPENPDVAVATAGPEQATTGAAASTTLNHSKLHAVKLLAANSGAPRSKTTEMTSAGITREQAASQPAVTATSMRPATARSATTGPFASATTMLAAEAPTRNAGERRPAKNTSSAPAATGESGEANTALAAPAALSLSRAAAVGTLSARPVAFSLPLMPELPTPLPAIISAKPTVAVLPPAPVRQPRFWLGLVTAPDISTVKFSKVQAPLPNLGLTLDYRLGPRLRLSTGLLRSTKQYSARREDYDWGPYAGRVYQRDFKDVDATCTVLDIPLNLRYDLLARPRYQLVGSVGLSSFFMQREHYTYDYVENNLPQRWQRDAVNENRHLLSILNLSLGYEGRLSDHWRFQAEPYLKVPLAGVGAGKVRLTSAGVFVGVKYGFN